MVVVDTSVWIDFLRRGDPKLAAWIDEGVVLLHPFVIEELACGTIERREEVVSMLERLPMAPAASHAEFMDFVVMARLAGSGLSAVDVHLLASTRLAGGRLWTHDKALASAARRLGVLADAGID